MERLQEWIKCGWELGVDWVFPPRCPVCDRVLERGTRICLECEEQLSFVEGAVCLKCGKPVGNEEQEYCHDCSRFVRSFIKNDALLVFDQISGRSMASFKYRNKREYAKYYAAEWMKRYGGKYERLALDGVVPVPIHKKKKRVRGYNQAYVLGKEIAVRLGIPCYEDYLVRVVNTQPQKELNDKQRVKNLEHAFVMGNNGLGWKRVLLVDDIYTTGATMEACTHLLLQEGGAEEVYCASVCVGKGF